MLLAPSGPGTTPSNHQLRRCWAAIPLLSNSSCNHSLPPSHTLLYLGTSFSSPREPWLPTPLGLFTSALSADTLTLHLFTWLMLTCLRSLVRRLLLTISHSALCFTSYTVLQITVCVCVYPPCESRGSPPHLPRSIHNPLIWILTVTVLHFSDHLPFLFSMTISNNLHSLQISNLHTS